MINFIFNKLKENMSTKNKPQYWTKEEIKKLINIWNNKTLEEICYELSRTKTQILSMTNQIKKEGYKLQIKRKNKVRNKMIKEVLNELGLIK